MTGAALPTIQLTPAERELAGLLVDCTNWIQTNPQQVDALRQQDADGEWIGQLRDQKPVELRVAGGWVRDKVSALTFPSPSLVRTRLTKSSFGQSQLLGLESDDIDISVSPAPLTGLKFATLFESYLASIGKREVVRPNATREPGLGRPRIRPFKLTGVCEIPDGQVD